MDKVRIGVIGIGNMGTHHIKYIFEGAIQNAVLSAVCDINPARLDYVKQTYGEGVALYGDYKTMFADKACDLVIIAVPHYLHPVMGIEAFNNGIHVLSEKPIGVFTKKVEEMNRVARESGLVFGIMYNQRTYPPHQKLREIVQSGELGKLYRNVWIITNWYRTQAYYNSGGWRATWEGEGGGVLINQCPHNLDLWQWIYGMPTKVRATCAFGKYHDIEVEDEVAAFTEYADGSTGTFITTTGEFPGTNRLEITGDKGKLVFEDGKIKLWRNRTPEREFCFTTKEGFAGPGCDYEEITVEGKSRDHADITQNVVNAILFGEELLAPGYEGINGLTISNAIHLSSWTNTTVELPIDGDKYLELLNQRIKGSKTTKVANLGGGVADLSGTYNTK